MSETASVGGMQQAWLLQWLRWRRLCNACRLLLGESGVRPLTIFLCSLVVCHECDRLQANRAASATRAHNAGKAPRCFTRVRCTERLGVTS